VVKNKQKKEKKLFFVGRFVPHDLPGLVKLFGSEEYFCEQLKIFFDKSQDDPFNVLPNPYYYAGNEV
jgi:putative alpha-1,2-mannosidase